MEFISSMRPVFGSILDSEISFIISVATRSVHFDQVSTTRLYFSLSVVRPSRYCCSYSRTRWRVSSISLILVSGTTMSSLPNEMPALQASRKPRPITASANSTVSFWPQWR